MKLDDLEKKLYQKNPKGISEQPKEKEFVAAKPPETQTGWTKNKEPEAKKGDYFAGFLSRFGNLSRWLFWFFTAATVVAAGFIAYYFYYSAGNSEVSLVFKAPSSTLLAVPFDLDFEFKNNSGDILKDVKLSMILPEGTGFASQDPEKRVFEKNIGDLAINGSFQDKINLIIFSTSQSVQRFEITASYFTPGLGATVRFKQTKTVDITVNQPALKLDLTAPQKVLNNKSFEIKIDYQNISDINFSNAELKLTYPDSFVLGKADNPSSFIGGVWKLGDLEKNGKQESLIIIGRILGAEESFFDIKASLSAEILGQKYLINEKAVSLNIASSPLIINILLNDQANYTASLGDYLRYKINYSNNSDVGLNDVVIKAKLMAVMFDLPSFQSNGFFDSKNATITWNAANTPSLRVLNPGANGSVEFAIRVKDSYPVKRVSDKNFVLEVQGEISSPTIPDYVDSDITVGLASLKTKVGGKVVIDSQLKETSSPRVNAPTNFTVRLLITNYSTDIASVEVKAFLQSGVKWLGEIKNTISSSTLTYNERTQEVIWLIDKIPATKGVVSSPVEASFQVQATPNVTQVNQPMPILSEINLRAHDEFTGVDLTSKDMILSTQEPVTP